MSAWPEAVWIVKKLQKNFDFEQELDQYAQNLNNLNTRVNDLIDDLEEEDGKFVTAVEELNNRVVTFISAKDSQTGLPVDLPENYGDGTIWLVTR